jgi:hypothetical protein
MCSTDIGLGRIVHQRKPRRAVCEPVISGEDRDFTCRKVVGGYRVPRGRQATAKPHGRQREW